MGLHILEHSLKSEFLKRVREWQLKKSAFPAELKVIDRLGCADRSWLLGPFDKLKVNAQVVLSNFDS